MDMVENTYEIHSNIIRESAIFIIISRTRHLERKTAWATNKQCDHDWTWGVDIDGARGHKHDVQVFHDVSAWCWPWLPPAQNLENRRQVAFNREHPHITSLHFWPFCTYLPYHVTPCHKSENNPPWGDVTNGLPNPPFCARTYTFTYAFFVRFFFTYA